DLGQGGGLQLPCVRGGEEGRQLQRLLREGGREDGRDAVLPRPRLRGVLLPLLLALPLAVEAGPVVPLLPWDGKLLLALAVPLLAGAEGGPAVGEAEGMLLGVGEVRLGRPAGLLPGRGEAGALGPVDEVG